MLENGDHDGTNVDLDELAKKRTAGGGLLDSVANMANSILGAGVCTFPLPLLVKLLLMLMVMFRHHWSTIRSKSSRILYGHILIGGPHLRH